MKQRTREEIEDDIKRVGKIISTDVAIYGHTMLQTELLLDIRDLLQPEINGVSLSKDVENLAQPEKCGCNDDDTVCVNHTGFMKSTQPEEEWEARERLGEVPFDKQEEWRVRLIKFYNATPTYRTFQEFESFVGGEIRKAEERTASEMVKYIIEHATAERGDILFVRFSKKDLEAHKK